MSAVAVEKRAAVKCGGHSRGGKPCGHPAGYGTDHIGFGNCKHHGGASPAGKKHAVRIQVAELLDHEYVGELDIEPHEALLQLVRRAARKVDYWSRRVAELEGGDQGLVVDYLREREWTGGEEGGGTETITSSSADLHIAVVALHEAEERLAKFAKIALDAGVEERRVRVAEALADDLSAFIRAVLDELDLTAEQRERAPAAVGRHLRVLEAAS